MAIFYLDEELGNDATTATPLGWWSVAYTGGTAPQPVADELATGATSGATARLTTSTLTGGTWAAGTAAGTLYFYGKSVTAFVAEQVNFAGGGHAHILVDLTYCAWRTISSGATAARIATGDTIRLAKSENPTSLGTGTWTTIPATLPSSFVITSSTNASPIQITTSLSHSYGTGDVVYIQDHTTNLTANGTWIITFVGPTTFTLDGSTGVGIGAGGNATKIPHQAVKLASAQTKTITRCEQIWTVDNASTVTLETGYYKEGDASAKIVMAAPANSTLYAHFQIGGGAGVNFSSYQKVTFWIRNDTAILANQWNICLCSDTAGATIVDTIAIPAQPGLGVWTPFTIARNGGGNLGASIQSIALYSGSSAGATTGITLDNFVACTTSGLNHQSLISKNTTAQTTMSPTGYANEAWYCIQSISEDGKVLRLDGLTYMSNPSSYINLRQMGYSEATGTVTTYKRETTKLPLSAGSTTVNQFQDSGISSASLIQYQGGYDTATNTQIGETYLDGLNGFGSGIASGAQFFSLINYISLTRVQYGIYFSNPTNAITIAPNFNNMYAAIYVTGYTTNIDTIINANNSFWGLYISSAYQVNVTTIGSICGANQYGINIENSTNNSFTTINKISNCASCGISVLGSHNNRFGTITECSYNGIGVQFGGGTATNHGNNNTINSLSANYNTTAVRFWTAYNNIIRSGTATQTTGSLFYFQDSDNYVNNFAVSGTLLSTPTSYHNDRIYFTNYNNTANSHYIATDLGSIASDITNRHTASGICWKLSPTNAYRDVYYPLKLKIATMALFANVPVVAKVWILKDNATAINAVFVLPGFQIAGVNTDVTATKANDTSYEQLSLTFTPTEAGVVEFYVYVYGGTTNNVYVDDFSIIQQ